MTSTLTPAEDTRAATHEVRLVAVQRVEEVSPSFVRVVFGPAAEGEAFPFELLGSDQWFRLFLPVASGELLPPWGPAEGWYQRWQRLPAERRAVIRNYTVRRARGGRAWEFDVDFVLHRGPSGELEGTAARWAAAARPGDQVAVLGQATIFDRLPDPSHVVAVCDETGLPGVEAILAGLPDDVRADVVAEIPSREDVRELPGAASVVWAVRQEGTCWADALRATLGEQDSVYAVGCNALALGARRMAIEAGVDDEQITFCSYWRAPRS